MLPSFQEIADDITARANIALPGLTGIYRTQRLNRENWSNLVNGNSLVPDWLLIEAGMRRPMPYAMDSEAYALPVSLYYVRQNKDGVTDETYSRLQSLSTDLWGQSLTTCSLMNDEPTLDVTENNPANLVFFGLQAQLFAGMLSFEVKVGSGIYYTV